MILAQQAAKKKAITKEEKDRIMADLLKPIGKKVPAEK